VNYPEGSKQHDLYVVLFIFVACCPKFQYCSESEGQKGECQTQNWFNYYVGDHLLKDAIKKVIFYNPIVNTEVSVSDILLAYSTGYKTRESCDKVGVVLCR